MLVNITNDAWYGWSSAPYQHFEQAAMRAIEEGRYLARSANTGISGIVDPYGRVLQRSAMFQPEVLRDDAGGLDIRFRACPLRDAWQQAGVRVESNLSPAVPLLRMDARYIKQALLNLIKLLFHERCELLVHDLWEILHKHVADLKS